MANELQIWALDGEDEVTRVGEQTQTESEKWLEKILAKQPEMLMPDLTLIGRQLPTHGGPLDLLGLDEKGRLVVFELKKQQLTREAVTQIIDYASSLDAMSDDELEKHIADRSKGREGIDPIENFREWYQEQEFLGDFDLRPVQMTLVGLGADARATRMVDFLAKQGLPIAMLTFRCYKHGDQVFFAKHVQVEREVAERARAQTSRREIEEQNEKELDKRIADFGVRDFWDDVYKAFAGKGKPTFQKNSLRFYRYDALKLPDHHRSFNNFLSILLTPEKKIRIIFFPVGVHLCRDEFERYRSRIDFQEEQTRAVPTNEIKKQWYLDLVVEEWNSHKEDLVKLADAVDEAWRRKQRERQMSGKVSSNEARS